MKHATPEGLDQLEELLADLRALEGLREKKRGVFYRKSRAFLHFHEDPSGLYADVRLSGADFQLHRVSTRKEQRDLVRTVRKALEAGPGSRARNGTGARGTTGGRGATGATRRERSP